MAMITLNQIKDAIVGKLAKGGFRVFDERIRAPDLAQGAVVQVMLEPLTSQIVGGGVYEERSLMADCAWVEAEVSPLGAMYDAVEGMGRALQPGREKSGGREPRPGFPAGRAAGSGIR